MNSGGVGFALLQLTGADSDELGRGQGFGNVGHKEGREGDVEGGEWVLCRVP